MPRLARVRREPRGGIVRENPVALIEAGLVHSCSPSARAEGVARGIRLREAQLRCPALVVLPYDAALDARAFEPVVRAIEAAVPGVQLVRPGTLAMRARGPVRYYGGEEAAARALLATAAEAGVEAAQVGIADGPFAAEQAARGTRSGEAVGIVPAETSAAFLAPLPVRLVADARTATLLNRLGVRTLGEFAALPEADVRRRFGAAGAFAHDLAAGREATRVVPRTPPPEFAVEQEFEPPLDRVDQLAFAFRVRADEFVDRLRASRLVCTALRIDLDDERGGHSSRAWLHPRWFTAADVVDRLRWQLQGAASAEAGLASPVVRVRVVPERVDSTGDHEDGLWGGGPDERIHHGLTRVQSLLGHDAVVTAAIGGGRMLADRQVLVPWGDRAPTASTAPWPGSLPTLAPASVFRERPAVRLLDAAGESVAIDARGSVSAPPATFAFAGGAPGPVTAWAGPWPIVERWWDAEHARRVHRFQIVDGEGCAWLLVLGEGGWQAEARYD
ncbi:DNA polymerase Y family protein [Agromyces protaetiae]|uniref:DNA polymerase Y family protein n=1 Tax=Agromyces protaetiae TaxID=2509455 RepID=UPI00312C9137